MSIQRRFNYTEPIVGADREAITALDLADVDVDGTLRACIVASAPGRQNVAIDVNDFVLNAIHGKLFDGFYGRGVTRLSAEEAAAQTALSVLDDDGFADLDPVAIFNVIGDTPEYRLINGAPAANVITVNAGLTAVKHEGAWIVNLADALFSQARGFNFQSGVKSAMQRPSAATIAAVDGTGDAIDLTTTLPDQDRAVGYDVYVREAAFTRIEPNWIPDAADITTAATTLSTFEGGADCVPDGGGGALVSGGTYYIAAVMKTSTGRTGSDISEISNVLSFTLD